MVDSINKIFVLLLLCCGSLYAINQIPHHNLHLFPTDSCRVAIAITLNAVTDHKSKLSIPGVFSETNFKKRGGGFIPRTVQNWIHAAPLILDNLKPGMVAVASGSDNLIS